MEVSGQLHAPAALPQGKNPCYHWIGGWVGPQSQSEHGFEPQSCTPYIGDVMENLHAFFTSEPDGVE